MHPFENAQREGIAFQRFHFGTGDEKGERRTRLYDVRPARIQIDRGDVQAGKPFPFAERQEPVDGEQDGFPRHTRAEEAFHQVERGVRKGACLPAAAHAVRKGAEKIALVDAQHGSGIAAGGFPFFGGGGHAERRIVHGRGAQDVDVFVRTHVAPRGESKLLSHGAGKGGTNALLRIISAYGEVNFGHFPQNKHFVAGDSRTPQRGLDLLLRLHVGARGDTLPHGEIF